MTGHLRDGGIAYITDNGWLIEAEGARCTSARPRADVPQSWDGRAGFMVANVLAAVAATRALGVQVTEDIRAALASFGPGEDNPGRMDIFCIGEIPVGRRLRTQPGRAVGRRRLPPPALGPGRAWRCLPCPATGPTPSWSRAPTPWRATSTGWSSTRTPTRCGAASRGR